MKKYKGVEVYLHRFWSRHYMEGSGQFYAPAILPRGIFLNKYNLFLLH
jgi:hypothetical protein